MEMECILNSEKTYSVEGDLVLNVNGFHFFDKLENCFHLYKVGKCRIFECEAGNEVIHENNIVYGIEKYVTRELTLIREISIEKIKAYFEANANSIINHKNSNIRCACANLGIGLDKLICDESPYVRAAVVEQKYGLNILINDEDIAIRIAVAEQGYGLDRLINDKRWTVRAAVARQGYGLERLINDKKWEVRITVARQGYGLDHLINDKHLDVRMIAKHLMEKQEEK